MGPRDSCVLPADVVSHDPGLLHKPRQWRREHMAIPAGSNYLCDAQGGPQALCVSPGNSCWVQLSVEIHHGGCSTEVQEKFFHSFITDGIFVQLCWVRWSKDDGGLLGLLRLTYRWFADEAPAHMEHFNSRSTLQAQARVAGDVGHSTSLPYSYLKSLPPGESRNTVHMHCLWLCLVLGVTWACPAPGSKYIVYHWFFSFPFIKWPVLLSKLHSLE